MRNSLPWLEVIFFRISVPKTNNKKATMKPAIPIDSKMKKLPSQSPIFPNTLEDLIDLSSIVPAWLWSAFHFIR